MRYSVSYQETPPTFTIVSQEEYSVGKKWAENIYTQVDAMSTTFMDDAFAEDLSTSFGNNPPMKGREALKKLFAWQFSAAKAFEHLIESGTLYQVAKVEMSHKVNISEQLAVIVLQDRIIAQVQVNYTFLDGTQESAKCVTIFLKDAKDANLPATELYMYGDFSKSLAKFVAISGPPSLA